MKFGLPYLWKSDSSIDESALLAHKLFVFWFDVSLLNNRHFLSLTVFPFVLPETQFSTNFGYTAEVPTIWPPQLTWTKSLSLYVNPRQGLLSPSRSLSRPMGGEGAFRWLGFSLRGAVRIVPGSRLTGQAFVGLTWVRSWGFDDTLRQGLSIWLLMSELLRYGLIYRVCYAEGRYILLIRLNAIWVSEIGVWDYIFWKTVRSDCGLVNRLAWVRNRKCRCERIETNPNIHLKHFFSN